MKYKIGDIVEFVFFNDTIIVEITGYDIRKYLMKTLAANNGQKLDDFNTFIFEDNSHKVDMKYIKQFKAKNL